MRSAPLASDRLPLVQSITAPSDTNSVAACLRALLEPPASITPARKKVARPPITPPDHVPVSHDMLECGQEARKAPFPPMSK
eukprot:CAMPEP_0173189392 /NCGR_PEP_ID=MMETSP1141-20130122/11769_1 /TAXON_ID=483371 /ORGANISM="non described non described, Strain CCMP2298" /LENGTH=81 /DNA_ID=CAMNT_0014113395 /DNA_START=1361 /DNA_END=1606 /DNA_ORIENTATION=+